MTGLLLAEFRRSRALCRRARASAAGRAIALLDAFTPFPVEGLAETRRRHIAPHSRRHVIGGLPWPRCRLRHSNGTAP